MEIVLSDKDKDGQIGSGSGHSISRSGHGKGNKSSSLGFKAGASAGGASSRTAVDLAFRAKGGQSGIGKKHHTQWAELLIPGILFEDSPTRLVIIILNCFSSCLLFVLD